MPDPIFDLDVLARARAAISALEDLADVADRNLLPSLGDRAREILDAVCSLYSQHVSALQGRFDGGDDPLLAEIEAMVGASGRAEILPEIAWLIARARSARFLQYSTANSTAGDGYLCLGEQTLTWP